VKCSSVYDPIDVVNGRVVPMVLVLHVVFDVSGAGSISYCSRYVDEYLLFVEPNSGFAVWDV
jgi:hypothetical protein